MRIGRTSQLVMPDSPVERMIQDSQGAAAEVAGLALEDVESKDDS